jgi:hypothetical protein
MRAFVSAPLLCTLLIALIMPSIASAQDINAQGAAHLKTMFQDILDKQAAMYAEIEGPTVTYDGDIMVEQASTYYAITLPATIIEMPDEPKSTIKVGVVSINAIPHEKAKQWKMTFTTPSPILGYDAEGQENFRVNIGKQRASGIWHEDFENFIKLDANYENINADVKNAPNFMALDKVSIIYDLSEDENARWSGPSQMTATNLQLTPPENKGHISLGEISMITTIQEANLLSIKNYATLLTETQDGTPDMATIIDAIMGYADGFGTSIKIAGLKVQEGSKDEITDILDLKIDKKPIKFTDITLDEAHFHMDAEGLLKDKTTASMSMGYTGFKAEPMDKNKRVLTPNNFAFTIKNNNVPLQQITTMVTNAMTSEANIDNKISMALIVTKIPALLAMAGTTLEIENSMSNDTFAVDTNGIAKAEMNSIFGGTANMTTTIKNLDKMIEAAKALMQNTNEENIGKNKQLLTALSTLKTTGTVSQDEAGNTIHTFKLIMDQTGSVTLNGQPAMPILFSLQGLF